MRDYRRIITDVADNIANANNFSRDTYSVFAGAIIGHMKHEKSDLEKNCRNLRDVPFSFSKEEAIDLLAMRNYSTVDSMIRRVSFFFGMASLGYRPTHDAKELDRVEQFAVLENIYSEEDNKLPFNPMLLVDWEKSAFTPEELKEVDRLGKIFEQK